MPVASMGSLPAKTQKPVLSCVSARPRATKLDAASSPAYSVTWAPSWRRLATMASRMPWWSPAFTRTWRPAGSRRERSTRPWSMPVIMRRCAPAPPTEKRKRRGPPRVARSMRRNVSSAAVSASSRGTKWPTRRTCEAGMPSSSSCCSHLGVCTRLMAGGGTAWMGCTWLSKTRLMTREKPHSRAVWATKVCAAMIGVSRGRSSINGFRHSQKLRMPRDAFTSPEVNTSFQIRSKTRVLSAAASREHAEYTELSFWSFLTGGTLSKEVKSSRAGGEALLPKEDSARAILWWPYPHRMVPMTTAPGGKATGVGAGFPSAALPTSCNGSCGCSGCTTVKGMTTSVSPLSAPPRPSFMDAHACSWSSRLRGPKILSTSALSVPPASGSTVRDQWEMSRRDRMVHVGLA
mmetsp:Transcript_75954/g.214940  ORF Transcript_75954/g.214940 Transcript_75954/m.214940 type:complete len:405 (-) Transcript_75954:42-1256(-)